MAEGALRLILEPVDYLKPTLIDDPVLGHRILDRSGGHDRWGFRNRAVPAGVDVVTIGDSQTYGMSAIATNAWPAWLERSTGFSVYNMSLGGWGPIQYEHLLQERALSLNPRIVVVGIYLGNDFFDAHRVVYGLDHWKWLRAGGRTELASSYASVELGEPLGLVATTRRWLNRNSMLFRLAGSALGDSAQRLRRTVSADDPDLTHVRDSDFQSIFTPKARRDVLDASRPTIREGIAQTQLALARMVRISDEAGVRLVVLLIPTKESVHAERIQGRPELNNATAIEDVLRFEERQRQALADFLAGQGIEVVDPLEAMRRAVRTEAIYPSSTDGHPVSAGYRIIAEQVAVAIGRAPRPSVGAGE